MLPERWSKEAAMNSRVSSKFSIQNMVSQKKKSVNEPIILPDTII